MGTLKKRIIFNQAVLFFYVVVILGFPYLWLSVDLAKSQVLPFLIVCVIDAFLLMALFLSLPRLWSRPLFSLERALSGKGELDYDNTAVALQLGAKLPARLAFVLFVSGYGIFLLGILGLRLAASFSMPQILQGLVVGLIVCLVYSLFTFFSIESAVRPVLIESMESLPRRVSLQGMNLSQKLMITCGSLVFITVLFTSSTFFVQGKKAVESQAVELQRNQLNLALRAHAAGNLFEEEKNEPLKETAEKPQLRGDISAYLLTRTGSTLASNPHGLKPELPAELVSKLIQEHSGAHVDKLRGKIYAFRRVGPLEDYLVTAVDRSQLIAPLRQILWTTSPVCLLPLLVGFYLSYVLAKSITAPMSKLGLYARQISEGGISEKVSLVSGDEVGMLADAFDHMHCNFIKLAGQARKIAGGDLSQRVDFPGPFGKAINTMVTNFSEMSRQIQEAAARIGSSSSEILHAAQEQASGAAQQATSVSETTATMEELSTTARQIAENTSTVTTVAEVTLRSAEEGQGLMAASTASMVLLKSKTGESSEKILALGEKSQQIGEVIDIISEIAIETKMLSLNAAIEAAKAGDAGKGFSVVAREIRRLAEDVVKSTGVIKDVLLEIQSATAASVLAAQENVKSAEEVEVHLGRVRGALEHIIAMAEQTAGSARQISQSTGQQKEASEQVFKTMREISKVARQTAATAEHSISSASDLKGLAEQLRFCVSRFKIG